MIIKDFYPLMGTYRNDQALSFGIDLENDIFKLDFELKIYHINNLVHFSTHTINCENKSSVVFDVSPQILNCGYVAELKVNEEIKRTAFDIQDDWTDFPRYGFLSKFSPEVLEEQIKVQLSTMAKFHINGIQFYDWQYRHDALLPTTREYIDPLGRKLSMDIIHKLIEIAHQKNMIAMPYLAIYGASIDFWNEHPEWGLYDEDGSPLLFEDFLGLMDPTKNSKWCQHLDNECNKVLENTSFDGLHIDQYGDPKKAWSFDGEEIDLPKAFVDFINYQKETIDGSVVFNAVGNWPVDKLAKSKADLMYIEVWEPTPKFLDLQEIVENARKLSGKKPVVIPIYIKKENWVNVLLADAVITSSGGTHLEIGDGNYLLSDPYFPKSEKLSITQLSQLRRYWDFIIAYQAVFGPKAENSNLEVFVDSDEIQMISRRKDNLLAVNFIHFNKNDKWTVPQLEKQILYGTEIKIKIENKITNIYVASPDQDDWTLLPLPYQFEEGILLCSIPSIKYWSTLIIELER